MRGPLAGPLELLSGFIPGPTGLPAGPFGGGPGLGYPSATPGYGPGLAGYGQNPGLGQNNGPYGGPLGGPGPSQGANLGNLNPGNDVKGESINSTIPVSRFSMFS